MALEQDSNGFLVGTVITDIKRSRKNSDALLIEVKKIADLLKQQGHLQAGNSESNPPSNTNANSGSQRQGQQNNSGGTSNSSQSESSDSASSELNESNEQPAQRRRESLRQKRERQRRERQQQRLRQQEQQADSQADLTQNPPIPPTTDNNSASEQSSNSEGHNSRQRDSRGRFTSEADNDIPEPIIAGGDDATRGRDSRGRFLGSGNSAGDGVDLEKDGGGNGLGGLISGLGDRITSAITAGQELQEADPTIKAFQEVAEPLQRGYQFIFAGSSKKDKPYFAWFNKIWKSLKDINKNTAENSDGERGGGFLSNIAGFLLPIAMTILGFIAPIFLGISAAAVVAWGLFTKSGREFFMNLGSNIAAAWQWSVNAFSQYVIPALIATWDTSVKAFNEQIVPALTASWDWFTQQSTETWNGLTNWLSTELPSIVSGAWNSIIGLVSDQWGEALKGLQPVFDAIGDTWDSFMESAKGGWDALINTFTLLYNSLKELPVIGDAIQAAEAAVKVATEAAESAKQVVENTTNTVVDSVKSSYNSTVDVVSRVGSDAIDSVKSAHASAVDWTSRNVVEPVADGYSSAKDSVAGLIHIGESKRRGYNDYNRGGKGAASNKENIDLTNMTIGEIRAKQRLPAGHKDRIFAAGKYQIIGSSDPNNDTLGGAVEALGLDENAKFDAAMQEKIFTEYLADKKRPQIESFIKTKANKKGKVASVQDAGKAVAQEWASVGASAKGGRGWYDGDGSNNASINAKEMELSLIKSRDKYQELIASGMDEKKAYGIALGAYSEQAKQASSQQTTTPQKTILATPEQVKNAMPKAVQPVSAMPSIASISPIPSVTTQSAKMPEMPSLVLPLSNNVKSSPTTIIPDVGQTVSDQHIALIAFPYATSMGNNKG